MPRTEMVILVTKSREVAREALRELKRLDREGWVDLTCYSLVDGDEQSGLRVREASDCAETAGIAAAKGLTRALLECLAEAVDGGIRPEESALLITVEQRYAERVAAELETRGTTVRAPMRNSRIEAVLRSSIGELRSKIAWMAELLERESEKLERSQGSEKERIELGIRAGRTELAAERTHLQARLLALRAELESHLTENARITQQGPGAAALAADKYTEELEREIADINEDVALGILDHLDALAEHSAELREKAARTTGGAASAIEEQADELELHMRKYRADLSATLAASASLARNCMERLRTIALRRTGVEAALQHHMEKLEKRHALLKADIQNLQREDSHSWHDLTAGIRNTWLSLREPPGFARREYQ